MEAFSDMSVRGDTGRKPVIFRQNIQAENQATWNAFKGILFLLQVMFPKKFKRSYLCEFNFGLRSFLLVR
jgi:hypothetical protein